jgi:hypothetical protein
MNNQFGQSTLYLPPINQAVIILPSYNVGGIIIPGDQDEFKRMWLNKDFDEIVLDSLDEFHVPHMYRESNGRQYWNTYFFIRRRELEYKTAEELWINSPFHSFMMREIEVLLFTYSPYETTDLPLGAANEIPWSSSREEALAKKQRYLFDPATTLMFQEINRPIIYLDPQLLSIYRTLIERFQILARKTDDERICDYMDDLLEVSRRIQFIQSLCYLGLQHTMLKFKNHNNSYQISDPEIRELKLEPDGFSEISYKHTLFKFYKFCISYEKLTPAIKEKVYHLWQTLLYHQDIRLLVSSYLLPMWSCVKQDKLHTICSQLVLSYLRPTCITEQYVVSKLNR